MYNKDVVKFVLNLYIKRVTYDIPVQNILDINEILMMINNNRVIVFMLYKKNENIRITNIIYMLYY